ncbi:MAG: hypothetical protein D6725_13955 [Planctomycetota bacterium]|nr:MAG: hypothetical protein D6725_13955 [Planctomycetota bacterium]
MSKPFGETPESRVRKLLESWGVPWKLHYLGVAPIRPGLGAPIVDWWLLELGTETFFHHTGFGLRSPREIPGKTLPAVAVPQTLLDTGQRQAAPFVRIPGIAEVLESLLDECRSYRSKWIREFQVQAMSPGEFAYRLNRVEEREETHFRMTRQFSERQLQDLAEILDIRLPAQK